MKKVKVVHITQATIGGVEEYIKLFLSNFDKNKYEMELICPGDGLLRREAEELGVKVNIIDMTREISLIDDYKAYKKLKKVISEINPDIVHIHSSKAGILARLAIRKLKIPCVYNAHGWSFSMKCSEAKKQIYASAEKVCAKYTDMIVNISTYEQNLALEYKVANSQKMTVIYNGIDLNKYSRGYSRNEILSKLGIPENAYVIGMVGRITEQKSPQTFISIAKEISNIFENAYFILVGDGDLIEEIQRSIEEKQLKDKVIITGWTNEVAKYISTFDVAILTSKWEGFGLVLAEYMASGKPIVASNVGGIPNVISHNHNGILIEPNDVEGFINAIIKIKEDKTMANMFIENSYIDVKKKFDIKRVVKEHEKLYMKLLK